MPAGRDSRPRLVGRQVQVQAFAALTRPDAARWIMVVNGLSGSGKTFLLDWLAASSVSKVPFARVKLSPALRELDLVDSLAGQLGPAVAARWERLSQKLAEDERRAPINISAAAQSVSSTSQATVSNVSQSSVLNVDLGDYATDERIRRRTQRLDALVKALEPLARSVWVLFLDDMENLDSSDLRQFLLDGLAPRLHSAFPGFRLYLTGQEVPPLGFDIGERSEHILDAFTSAETAELLAGARIVDKGAQHVLFQFSGGHPLLLAMFLEALPPGAGQIDVALIQASLDGLSDEKRTQWIYDQIIARFGESAAREVAPNLSLLDWFDLGLLRGVFGDKVTERAFGEMVQRSFVKKMEGGRYRCHDIIRLHLQPQRLELDPDRAHEVYAGAFAAFTARMEREVAKLGEFDFKGRVDYVSAALHSALGFSAAQAQNFLKLELVRAIFDAEDDYLYCLARCVEAQPAPPAITQLIRDLKAALQMVNLGQYRPPLVPFLTGLAQHAAAHGEKAAAQTAWQVAANVAMVLGRRADAVAYARQAVAAQDNPQSRALLITHLAMGDDRAAAEQALGAAEAAFGPQPEFTVAQAQAAAARGDAKEAARLYTDAILNFGSLDARLRLAGLLTQQNDYAGALAQLDAVLVEDATNAEAQRMRTGLLSALGHWDEFLAIVSGSGASLILDTSDIERLLADPAAQRRMIADFEAGALPAAAGLPLLMVAASRGNVDLVDRLSARLLEQAPELRPLARRERGVALYLDGRPAEAIAVLQKLIAEGNPPPMAYYRLADCLAGAGQFAAARDVLLDGIEHEPAWALDRLDAGVGWCFINEGRAGDGLAYLARIQKERELGPQGLMARAQALAITGRTTEALAILERLVYTEDMQSLPAPEMISLYNAYAGLLIVAGRRQDAAAVGRQLLEAFSGLPAAIAAGCAVFGTLGDEAGLRAAAARAAPRDDPSQTRIAGTLAELILRRNATAPGLLAELRQHPDRVELVAAIDMLLTRSGQTAQVASVVGQAQRIAPGAVSAYARMSESAIDQFDPRQLVQLRAQSAANPANLDLRLTLGRILARRGQIDEARREFDAILAGRPGDRVMLDGQLGLGLIRAGRIDEAGELLCPYLEQDQPSAVLVTVATEYYMVRKDYEGHVAFCRRVAAAYPELRATMLAQVANLSLSAKKQDEALAALDALDREGNLPPDAALLRVQTLAELGREDEALAAADSVLAACKDTPELFGPASLLRGEILFGTGDLGAAQAAFEAALVSPSSQSGAYLGLSQVADRQGRWQSALEYMSQSIAFEPGLLAHREDQLRELRAKAAAAPAAPAATGDPTYTLR